jgi:hypothetical protein
MLPLNKNPEIIVHRCNTISELQNVPQEFGVEIDIRTNNGKLILHHDPLEDGVILEDWLLFFKHKTLILNVKEDGLENSIQCQLKKFNITNYFFLDQPIPSIVKFALSGQTCAAIRYSEYEPIDTAQIFSGKLLWAWVDCFNTATPNIDSLVILSNLNYKICIVSPELHNINRQIEIPKFSAEILRHKNLVSAICTKFPELWKNLLNEK